MGPEVSRLGALISTVCGRRPKRPNTPQPASPTAADPSCRMPAVSLLPGYQPHGEIQHHLYAALGNGPVPLDLLVERVSERLFHEELRRGGWAADIGVLGSGMYKSEIVDMVRALNGLTLRIEPLVDEINIIGSRPQ